MAKKYYGMLFNQLMNETLAYRMLKFHVKKGSKSPCWIKQRREEAKICQEFLYKELKLAVTSIFAFSFDKNLRCLTYCPFLDGQYVGSCFCRLDCPSNISINHIKEYYGLVLCEAKRLKKPPLGLVSKNLHTEKRINSIKEAIQRYKTIAHNIPNEWSEELNELLKQRLPYNPTEEDEKLDFKKRDTTLPLGL